ncbi:chemotaxis protein CheX [Caloramator sp. E03]|uniref:chemotaxis protein CheX n=1 Tax=Caloramator sp. E03 TaxID=2576307 RepID=UPI001110D76F|nr:chemotaxis protein CheX [Caloramator sp. E03]QCX33199.1 chemotaxis protein CheX [Caloramator sp. E03]
MTLEHLNIFIDSCKEVIGQITGLQPKTGDLYIKTTPFEGNNLVILIGIAGDFHGSTILSLNDDSAKKIASLMMGGFPISTLDEMAKSAIAELSNMILGHVSTAFSKNKINIDITPPTILTGENLKLSLKSTCINCIPFIFDEDFSLEMNISIK